MRIFRDLWTIAGGLAFGLILYWALQIAARVAS